MAQQPEKWTSYKALPRIPTVLNSLNRSCARAGCVGMLVQARATHPQCASAALVSEPARCALSARRQRLSPPTSSTLAARPAWLAARRSLSPPPTTSNQEKKGKPAAAPGAAGSTELLAPAMPRRARSCAASWVLPRPVRAKAQCVTWSVKQVPITLYANFSDTK
jgi:hypothetical protein